MPEYDEYDDFLVENSIVLEQEMVHYAHGP